MALETEKNTLLSLINSYEYTIDRGDHTETRHGLPVFDSMLSVTDIENGVFNKVEEAVAAYAKRLAHEGKLATVLNDPTIILGGLTTIEKYIREAKRYQLTEDGELYSTASARRDEIDGIPKGKGGQGHAAQLAAFLPKEVSSQSRAIPVFLENLKSEDGATALFEGEDDFRVLDIGFHNGSNSARVAKMLIDNMGVSPSRLIWDGMEIVPKTHIQNATAALTAPEIGVLPGNIHLKGGKVGFSDPLMDDKVSRNEALDLTELPDSERYKIVLAMKVNNLGKDTDGNPSKFFEHVDAAMQPGTEGRLGAITIAFHDAEGDAFDLRRQINADAGIPLMRNTDSVPDAIERYMGEQGRTAHTFSARYLATFPKSSVPGEPPIADDIWEAMKTKVETAVFNRDYREDVTGTAIDPEKYRDARLSLEFILGQPLTTYSDAERVLVLDAFKAKLQETGYKLSGMYKGQVVLSREHSLDLEEAVDSAARATDEELSKPPRKVTPRESGPPAI